MSTRIVTFVFCLCALILCGEAAAQIKIGYNARSLGAPNITLLDLSVDPNASFGKGFIYPVVSAPQRDAMSTNNSNLIPNGMTVFNKDANSLQVYSTVSNTWLSFSAVDSDMRDILQADLAETVSSAITTYHFASTLNIKPNGKVLIVYNNITLKRGVDFDIALSPASKTITFKTLVPEEFAGFSTFQLEISR